MTQFKGTQGKWKADILSRRAVIYVKEGCYFVDCWGDGIAETTQEQLKANAQLISKAPEMLEMLVKCKDYFKSKEQAYYKIIEQLIEEATKTH